METKTTSERSLKPWLRALDPKLPTLATRAAIQLDNLRRQKETDRSAIQQLAELLKNSFDQIPSPNATGAKESLLDVSTQVAVGRALQAAYNEPVTKIDQMQRLAEQVAQQLDRIVVHQLNQPLEQLRDFCVALAREVASYHRSIRDARQPHPFRN